MALALRIEKLNIFLKDEIAKILNREIEFPEGLLVTITRIAVASDLHYATVFFSALGGEAKEVLALLEKNVYHIQQVLNRAVRMRPVPKLRFMHDQGEAHREGIEASLARLKRAGEL